MDANLEDILQQILRELKHQSKMMEYLYEKKDESRHDAEKHIKDMQDMMLRIVAPNPDATNLMKQVFQMTGTGGKPDEN